MRQRACPIRRISAAFAAVLASTAAASAQNIANEVMARDSTLAYGVGLKTWDSIKLYGAERVDERDRKPWLPDGMHIANHWVYAGVGSTTLIDNNVLGKATNPRSDTIQQIDPYLRISTDIPRHTFDFALGGRFTTYMENESFDHVNASVGMNGAIQITHADELAFTLRGALDHMDRITVDEPKNAAEATAVWHNRAAMSFKHDAGRLWASAGASWDEWTFDPVRAYDGTMLDQRSRDQRIVAAHSISGYRFSPGYDLIVKGRVLRQDNPTTGDPAAGVTGLDGAFGLKAEINPLFRWHMFGGQAVRNFDVPGPGSTGGNVWEAGFAWLPYQVMTLSGLIRRDISDGSELAGSAGRVDNLMRLKLEYEARRNLVFTLQGDQHDLAYGGTSRSDQLLIGQLAVNYLHSKNAALSLSFEHLQRLSTIATENISRDRLWLNAKLRI